MKQFTNWYSVFNQDTERVIHACENILKFVERCNFDFSVPIIY